MHCNIAMAVTYKDHEVFDIRRNDKLIFLLQESGTSFLSLDI